MILRIAFLGSVRSLALLATVLTFSLSAFSQSTEQQLPTPVSINEINGSINPREIGDSRTTTYFYTFNGSQGDLFLNILSVNLNADIDLFIESGLRPLTKISVYADRGETETGRVVYLRKPEKLLLRVQGRSPNDDPGTFRFKFAGSFVAAASDSPLPPELPKVPEAIVAEARPTRPDPKPAEDTKQIETDDSTKRTEVQDSSEANRRKAEVAEKKEPKTKPKLVLTDPIGEAEKRSDEIKEREARENRTRTESARETARREREEARRKTETPDPMAAFRLVIVFRDGSRIERPMTEVSRFTVDRGTLTVVNKGGTTGRYSMTDVVSVTIE